MTKFRIQPHGRLQEWVAEEKGYFKNEGLDYEFVHGRLLSPSSAGPSDRDGTGGGPAEVRSGGLRKL